MRSKHLVIGIAAAPMLLACALADAAQRTFVGTTGVDNPSCSLAAPCRTFTAALVATNLGGEIIVLESGGYGTVTIAQSVSITAPPGVYAGISVFAGDGVTVNAGAGMDVKLKGLTITGLGGANGIVVSNVGTFEASGVEVVGFTNNGIAISGTGDAWQVRNSQSRNNGAAGLSFAATSFGTLKVESSEFDDNDIGIQFGSANATAAISNSGAMRNGTAGFFVSSGRAAISNCRTSQIASALLNYGIHADGSSRVSVDRCVSASHNTGFAATAGADLTLTDSVAYGPGIGLGVYVDGVGSNVVAERVTASGFSLGFRASNSGTMRVSNCTATGNGTGLSNSGGTLETRGNNTVRGNTTETSGTSPFTPL